MYNNSHLTTSLVHNTLSTQVIHLWHIPLNPPPSRLQLNILSNEEHERFKSFYFDKHRYFFANAKIATRHILSLYLHIAPQAIEFVQDQYGKPKLKQPGLLEFNLSHSQDSALLAIGMECAVGVDLEFFSLRPFLGIAENLFSLQEYSALSQLHPALLPKNFFSIWSQKEALIKQLGLGLSYPTQSINLQLSPKTPYAIYEPIHKITLKIKAWMPSPGLCAALCYDPSIQTIHHFNYEQTLSIQNLARAQSTEFPA